MSKSRSPIDQAAVFQHVYNEELGALEVVIVGADLKVDSMTQNILVDTSKMEQLLKTMVDEAKASRETSLQLCQSMQEKDTETKWIEVPQIVKEIQIVEIPTIVIQEKLVEVVKEVVREVPGPTKIEVVTVTVEKEVIVIKTEYKDLSKLLITGLVLQGLVQLIVALLHK